MKIMLGYLQVQIQVETVTDRDSTDRKIHIQIEIQIQIEIEIQIQAQLVRITGLQFEKLLLYWGSFSFSTPSFLPRKICFSESLSAYLSGRQSVSPVSLSVQSASLLTCYQTCCVLLCLPFSDVIRHLFALAQCFS